MKIDSDQDNRIVKKLEKLKNRISDLEVTEAGLQKFKSAYYETEHKYKQLIELAQEGIWVVDEDSKTTLVNPRMTELLGYSEQEMEGRQLFEFMNQNDSDLELYNLGNLDRSDYRKHDYEFKRKDGTKIFTTLETSPITDVEGNYIGTIACVTDITDRKHAEEALRESEESYRDLFENANDLIQFIDDQGRFQNVNNKWLELLGYSNKEVNQLTISDIIPEDQIHLFQDVEKKVKMGEDIETFETVFLTRDGHKIYVEGTFNARFKNGKFESIRGIFRDISDRKLIKEALEATENKLKQLLHSSPNGFILMGLDGTIWEANPAMTKIMGLEQDQIIGKPFKELCSLNDDSFERYLESIKQLPREDELGSLELELTLLNGEEVWIELLPNLSTIEEEIIAIQLEIVNITNQKLAEEKAIDESKHEQLFFNLFTNDMNNLHQTIESFCKLLKINYERSGELKTQIRDILIQSTSTAKLIDTTGNLLNLLKEKPKMEIMSVSEMINDLNLIFNRINSDCRVQINHTLNDPPAFVKGHIFLIKMFELLIDSFVRQNKYEGALIDITHTLIEDGKFWRFDINDMRNWLPGVEDDKEFKLVQNGKTTECMPGLSLTVINEIVRSCGGSVWVKELCGENNKSTLCTNFVVILPKGDN